MGVNIKDAFLDLHLGPATDLDDYMQETGRIGRESKCLGHAILLKYKRCTASKNITMAMNNYVNNTTTCRRRMLSHFGVDAPKQYVPHECCDICSHGCKCLCQCLFHCSYPNKCAQDGGLSLAEKQSLKMGWKQS